MRAVLLISTLFLSLMSRAQTDHVNSLPSGKYETFTKNNLDKWERGDIIIIDESRYRISSNEEIGEYRFSATAQRVFFTSGPLKTVFAKTLLKNNTPAIVLPINENGHTGLKLASEVWCYYKQ
jgi:hypothetical protein